MRFAHCCASLLAVRFAHWRAIYRTKEVPQARTNERTKERTNPHSHVDFLNIIILNLIIYINDINHCTLLTLLSFADDTTIYRSGPYNEVWWGKLWVRKIHTWLCTKKFSLNVKKSKVCIFRPPNSNYTLGNRPNCLCVGYPALLGFPIMDPVQMHTVLNCHHIKPFHPSVKQYTTAHHNTAHYFSFLIPKSQGQGPRCV